MKKSITLIITSIICFGYACNNSVKKDDKEVVKNQMSNVTESNESEHEHSTSDSIKLNNGEKWKVVPDMMQYIKNMESDVNIFHDTQHSDLKDFTLLGKNLQKNLDLLTSNCTMEGKAHDELHKWLLPYIDMVVEFNKSKDMDDATHRFDEIHASFKKFNTYFQ